MYTVSLSKGIIHSIKIAFIFVMNYMIKKHLWLGWVEIKLKNLGVLLTTKEILLSEFAISYLSFTKFWNAWKRQHTESFDNKLK